MQDTLLVELLTEELPPKALQRISLAFRDALVADLRKDDLLTDESKVAVFATPRRLAISITNVLKQAPGKTVEISGPSVKVGLDADGKPTPALAGFAKKNGVDIKDLLQFETPKGKVFGCRLKAAGTRLETNLELKVAEALKKLPIPKVMRWGAGDGSTQFVRPVHGLVMMHGSRVVPGTVLGLESSGNTLGHRFLSSGPVAIPSAGDYERVLLDSGKVVASYTARREQIVGRIREMSGSAEPVAGDALYDEITSLVEAPTVYEASFDAAFLDVPQECLVLSMQQHQKYVPLRDAASGKLLARFLFVANNRPDDPSNIVRGNERVLRARLSDAKFFYDQDRKVRLEDRVPGLKSVVYHNKLGSQLERVERVQLIAGRIARALGVDALLAERAAWLAKADLVTGMVGEFPELQGVMGRYYALHDGEKPEVADAIEAHYRPRHAGGGLPDGPVACAVALADKLETLAGMFGIGQQPTGDKDPFALRRQALGVVRILIERDLVLSLHELVDIAFAAFDAGLKLADARAELEAFVFERMRGYFADAGYTTNEIEAVLSLRPMATRLIPRQLAAVRSFSTLPEAPSLAAANKRIGNILRQAGQVPEGFDTALLKLPEESALARAFESIGHDVESAAGKHDYTGALTLLASLKAPVDAFFDKVMVMDEDVGVRANRIGLLGRLHATMNRIADISKLAA